RYDGTWRGGLSHVVPAATKKGRCVRPFFLLRQLGEQGEKLRALGLAQPSGDAALVPLDALTQSYGQHAARPRQPQAVGTPVTPAAPFDQSALFQRIDHADHGRAIETHRLGEAP